MIELPAVAGNCCQTNRLLSNCLGFRNFVDLVQFPFFLFSLKNELHISISSDHIITISTQGDLRDQVCLQGKTLKLKAFQFNMNHGKMLKGWFQN